MPISDIQAEVLKRIAVNRSPESYLAGATVIHREADTPRFSQDLPMRSVAFTWTGTKTR